MMLICMEQSKMISCAITRLCILHHLDRTMVEAKNSNLQYINNLKKQKQKLDPSKSGS